jgi:nitrite reductase (NADH) small subunit
MEEVFVAHQHELGEGERKIVAHRGTEVGVFRWDNEFYAYSNICLHQGGPACEGLLMHEVEDLIGQDKTWQGHVFSRDVINFVCPWHGYEYNLKTGACASDPALKLKSFPVHVRDGGIYVVIE